jgi:hypothetical protein
MKRVYAYYFRGESGDEIPYSEFIVEWVEI